MWELVSTVSFLSGFSDLIVLGVCCNSSIPSESFVMRSSLELIIIPLLRWQLLPSPSLAGSQTWCPVPPVVEGWHSGQPLIPHSMGKEQGWGHLRANPGFGVLWIIPPLLLVAYLPPISFIGRIFSCLSEVGLAWVQSGLDDRSSSAKRC